MVRSRRSMVAVVVAAALLVLSPPLGAERLIKQSTTFTATFLMVDSADHVTGKTALSPVCKISKAGASGVTPGGAISQVDSTNHPGLYKIAYTTTDTNTLNDLWATCTASGADPTDFHDQVVAFDPTDANALGLARLDAAVTTRMATFSLPANFSALVITTAGRIPPDQAVLKNVAFSDYKFYMFDATTGGPKAGLLNSDFAKQEAIDGAGWTTMTTTVSEIGNGVYRFSPTAAQLNGNSIMFRMSAVAAGASDTVWEIFPGK